MLLNRFFWLISLWPFIYLFGKLRNRKDLNCFDLLILFHGLYFAFLPLISSAKDFSYGLDVISTENTGLTILFVNMFNFLLVLFDIKWSHSSKGKEINVINTTLFLRTWYSSYQVKNKKIFFVLLCFPFFVIGGALAQQQSLAQATVGASFFSNDPKVLLVFQLLGALRVICAVYLFAHLLKKKQQSKLLFLDKCILCLFLVWMVTISRTFQVELALVFFLLYYSIKRYSIKKSFYVKLVAAALFLYFIIFPMFFYYRALKEMALADNEYVSTSLIDIDLIMNARRNNIKVEQNSDSRKLFLYCILAKCVSVANCQNGEMTKLSVEYGLPRVVFPNKPDKASEARIEKVSRVNEDVADSVLLFSFLDYGLILGPFGAMAIFLSLLFLWNIFFKKVNRYNNSAILALFFFNQVFVYSVRLETSPDTYLGDILHSFLLLFVIIVFVRIFDKYTKTSSSFNCRLT